MGLSGLCQNSVKAPYCKDWEPRYPQITSGYPNASHSKITTRIHPVALHNTPHAPPRHLQRTQCANRQQQTPTDTKRRLQTPQDTDRCCLSVYGGVCWHLLSSVSILCSLDIFDGCLRAVSWVCVGIWVVFMDIKGARMCLGGYLASQSLQYGAITLYWHSPERHILFSSDHTETSKYQNVYMLAQQKWLGFAIFWFFKACQRGIIKYSCYWSPCSK